MSRESQVRVVLVEGQSDLLAVSRVAVRRNLALEQLAVDVIALDGITNVRSRIDGLMRRSEAYERVAVLCDEAEAPFVGRAVARMAGDASGGVLPRIGIFVCRADLEDEMIRAMGETAVVDLIDATGERRAFETFQRQPDQRDRGLGAQLHRFLGTKSGRKALYGELMAESVPLGSVPQPIVDALDFVAGGRGSRHVP